MASLPHSPKPYSCVVCHNRKVKCDRKEPCSNCAKANVECLYRPPPRPRRRKRERDASENASQERDKSLRQMSPEPSRVDQPVKRSSPTGDGPFEAESKSNGSGRMIMKEGNSIYLDNTLWTSVSYELPNAADVLDNTSDERNDDLPQEEDISEPMMLMGLATRESLTEPHPEPLHIFKLWQTFLENVNPLIKIVHTPTLQPQILEATGDLPRVGKELEALMFAIYCIALGSLQADEVERSFGESKKKLLSRYRQGAQLALSKASILRTSNLMVLQAFLLYLLSMRAFSDPHTTWTMSGIALRIAQRMGIHRDGSEYGLSFFETEMRRRIWFQVVILDATSARSCGVASSPLPTNADTKPPMNINDSDLDPRMTESPCEKHGPTEMMFCVARSEFGKWLSRWSKDAGPSNSPWAFLSSSTMSLEQKDIAIDELENTMEKKFLQYCDRSIPLHLATITMARSAIHYTRLMAHHPRQYRDCNARISQAEKDIIFENCLKMAEYADYTQTNTDVQRFEWHTVHHMPWDAMIFMLSEMRVRTDPEEKSKVWEIVGNIYSRHVGQKRRFAGRPLHLALQTLMVKAWESYTEECHLQHRAPTACPTIIAALISNPKCVTKSHVTQRSSSSTQQTNTRESHHDPSMLQLDDNRDFDFLAQDTSPMDWNEWDCLLNQFQESLMDDMVHFTSL
ncbi:hypothetical protein N7494_007581 [Penicillium frequentans]|uniref:Zn(2)-C6 fungal-type domain-containing protein n=1 Tax=Penicillium frequentans TaxID=3151616 RepID=A0AAD6CUD7_9EURO|nr:hypothetical protein N7494_007581 [Penicillium glabrum]